MAITTLGLTGFEHGFVGAGAQNRGGGDTWLLSSATWSASTSSPRNGNYCAHPAAPANTATTLLNNTLAGAPTVRSSCDSGSSSLVLIRSVPQCDACCGSQRIASAGTLSVLSFRHSSAVAGEEGITSLRRDLLNTGWYWSSSKLTASPGRSTGRSMALHRHVIDGGDFPCCHAIVLGTRHAVLHAYTADYDDVIFGTWTVAATDWYGDGKVLAQLAGVDGTHATITAFSPGDAGTAYSGTADDRNTMVDDPPGTGGWTATRSTTDNIALRTATVGAYAEIKPATTAETGRPTRSRRSCRTRPRPRRPTSPPATCATRPERSPSCGDSRAASARTTARRPTTSRAPSSPSPPRAGRQRRSTRSASASAAARRPTSARSRPSRR